MTLAGTRPPTVDEWDKYELHHRARLATKPGLTGMWQVSGRSNITDFEEVVKLDKQYISEWTMGLDIKILFKTVQVVFKKEGSPFIVSINLHVCLCIQKFRNADSVALLSSGTFPWFKNSQNCFS